MGAALARAAAKAGHSATLILGPAHLQIPEDVRRIDVETTEQMLAAVQAEFPDHDLLIMAAAVADFRPKAVWHQKLDRRAAMTLELESTPDILATVSRTKRPNQRTVGFSLEDDGNFDRARRKLVEKKLDLIVYNTPQTIGSEAIAATLFYPDGSAENLPSRSKSDFADILIQRSAALFRSDH